MLKELQYQIKSRFTYETVPDPDGYVAIDLIASALDPRAKKLTFLPEDQREAVWKEIDKYPSIISHLSLSHLRLIKKIQPTLETAIVVQNADKEKKNSFLDLLDEEISDDSSEQRSELEQYRAVVFLVYLFCRSYF